MAALKKIIVFYLRFTPSYSGIGYCARRPFWKKVNPDFSGETWLVAGGSSGIGGAVVIAAANAGATVISAARRKEKLDAVARSVGGSGRVIPECVDLSLQREVKRLVDKLQMQGNSIDVLVDNVGIMRNEVILTDEGFETSFATNLQNHYLLTRELLDRGMLSKNATVISVSSGGMYNHPLVIDEMNNKSESYEGVRAYGLAKRGQVVLTSYWREKFAGTGMNFYVMHPGWCGTESVKRGMPRFYKILRPVLRTKAMAADTIIWLAAVRPQQNNVESIWFDRKERTTHIYSHTPISNYTQEDLVAFLEGNTQDSSIAKSV